MILDRAPRVGFVGVGWIGRHRMASLVKSGAAEAGAILDASPQAVKEARALAPDAKPVASLEEMLAMDDLDGVVIATPNSFHKVQCIQAFEAGKHVFCQKPLARTAEEVWQIIGSAKEHDRLLDIDLSYRHVTAMTRIRDLLRQGEIGEVFAVDLTFHNAYGPDKAWFYDPELSGGGCVLDLGIHMVDLGLWALDFPTVKDVSGRLYARGRRMRPNEPTVEDHAVARIDFQGGATATVACSWRGSHGVDAVIDATFHGIKGSLRMRNVNGSFWDFQGEQLQGTRAQTIAEPDDWGGRAIAAWAQRLHVAPRYDPDIERHVEVMDVLDRVYGR